MDNVQRVQVADSRGQLSRKFSRLERGCGVGEVRGEIGWERNDGAETRRGAAADLLLRQCAVVHKVGKQVRGLLVGHNAHDVWRLDDFKELSILIERWEGGDTGMC